MGNFDIPFVDKNSERHALSKRVGKIIDHVAATYLYPDSESTGNFEFRDGQNTIENLQEGEWRAFDSENEFWGYPECYCWFRQTVTVPERFAGKPVIYEVTPHERGWRETNPQLILFANGELLQGLDSNHRYVQLLDCAKGGEVFEIALNAYTDPFAWAGPVRMRASLKTVNKLAKRLYFDLATPLEVANLYGADDIARVKLIKTLNTACNMLEMGDESDVAAFDATALEACTYLKKELFSGEESGIVASCIGHTHIDVAWLWRLRQTRDKAGRSFATVLKYMEEYPEYKFMSPQAQLYDYVKQDYPQVYEGIKQRIAEGRWEAEGSMWVESDTNVISGESLVRQFLVGKRFFRQEFGVDNKIMWLPDVFGYTGALPQIIKKSGIDYFMTTKISWNEYDKVPFDTFKWQGIDGTSVLAHFATGTGVNKSHVPSHFTTYNSYLSPDQVIGGWQRYSNKDLNSEYLISFGYGDGGGGPTVEMLEHGHRMAKSIEGCPRVVQQPALDFFRQLDEQVSGDEHLPTWRGELYLQFHRGTLTAQARNKRYNRKSELLFHDAETLSALALQYAGAAYPAEEILENWKLILLNQFHDIIPGSSIKSVYEDSQEQYLQVLADGEAMAQAAMQALAANIGGCGRAVVFNTLGFARDDLAFVDLPELPAGQRLAVYDEDGSELPSQNTYDGRLCFLAKGVPAKGWKSFGLSITGAPAAAQIGVTVDGKVFENAALRVAFDENYNITELLHKATGRSTAPEGALLNRLIAYEDRPFNHDAWDIKAYFREKFWYVDDVQSAEIIEAGPARTVLRIVRNFLQSVIWQDFIFYPQGERVDVDFWIDWHERNIALKADYPVDCNAGRATFDIQFGNIERVTHENTSWDYAQFEVCGHKWADLSDNGFGLSVMNDCKYGWTVKDGHIQPTLLRCATGPNEDQDREEHRFTYALYPHAGAVDQSNAAREGYGLNVPLRAIIAEPGEGALPASFGLVAADDANVIIETVKKAEDSDALIVRLYETWNRRTATTLRFGGTIAEAAECDLMEENDVALPFEGAELPLVFKPFEIKTVKVRLA